MACQIMQEGEGGFGVACGVVELAGLEDDVAVVADLLEGGEDFRYGHVALAEGFGVEAVEVWFLGCSGGGVTLMVFLGVDADDVLSELGDLFEGIVAEAHAVGHVPVVADGWGVDAFEEGGGFIAPECVLDGEGDAGLFGFGAEEAEVGFEAGDGLVVSHHGGAEEGHEEVGCAEVGAEADAGADGFEAEGFLIGVGEAAAVEEVGGDTGDVDADLGRVPADRVAIFGSEGAAGLGFGEVVPVEFYALEAEFGGDGEDG